MSALDHAVHDHQTHELAIALLRRLLTPTAEKLKVSVTKLQNKIGENPVAAIGGFGVGLTSFLGNSRLPTTIKLPLQIAAGFTTLLAAHNRVSPVK